MAGVEWSFHQGIVGAGTRAEQQDDHDRPGWIAPAFVLDLNENPIRASRERDYQSDWTWLAGSYWHRSRDLNDKRIEPVNFYETAAGECPGGEKATTELPIKLSLADGSASSISLSGKNDTATVSIQVLVQGSGDAALQSVKLNVLEPADARLRVLEPRPTLVEVHALDAVPRQPSRSMGRIRRAQRAFSAERFDRPGAIAGSTPVPPPRPLNIVSDTTRPRLVLKKDKDTASSAYVSFGRLLLRTCPRPPKVFRLGTKPVAG